MISIEHDSRISCEPSEIRHIECYVVIVEPIKVSQVVGVGGTLYNGQYGEALPEKGAFLRLRVYKRVGISQVEVYKRVGKSVI